MLILHLSGTHPEHLVVDWPLIRMRRGLCHCRLDLVLYRISHSFWAHTSGLRYICWVLYRILCADAAQRHNAETHIRIRATKYFQGPRVFSCGKITEVSIPGVR